MIVASQFTSACYHTWNPLSFILNFLFTYSFSITLLYISSRFPFIKRVYNLMVTNAYMYQNSTLIIQKSGKNRKFESRTTARLK